MTHGVAMAAANFTSLSKAVIRMAVSSDNAALSSLTELKRRIRTAQTERLGQATRTADMFSNTTKCWKVIVDVTADVLGCTVDQDSSCMFG